MNKENTEIMGITPEKAMKLYEKMHKYCDVYALCEGLIKPKNKITQNALNNIKNTCYKVCLAFKVALENDDPKLETFTKVAYQTVGSAIWYLRSNGTNSPNYQPENSMVAINIINICAQLSAEKSANGLEGSI